MLMPKITADGTQFTHNQDQSLGIIDSRGRRTNPCNRYTTITNNGSNFAAIEIFIPKGEDDFDVWNKGEWWDDRQLAIEDAQIWADAEQIPCVIW